MTARRRFAVLGVLLGTALLASGVVLAVHGAAMSDTPATVVRDYFAALERGDAAQALAYGTAPPGPRRLLTSMVLHEQQQIAPLGQLTVDGTEQHGDRATVTVHYSMAFADGEVSTSTPISLHRTGGTWWLDRTAISAVLAPTTARDRLAVLGAPVPTMGTLLFPGALPISPDTPYLELVPALDYVSFSTPTTVDVPVRVSSAGEDAVRKAIRSALTRCLRGSADPACPLPTDRYLPGSMRGSVNRPLGGLIDLDQSDPAGVLTYAGTPTMTGHWLRLDFHNMAVRTSGQVVLDVRASGYAVAPLRMRWTH